MERQDRRFAALLVFGGIAFYFGLTHFNTVGRWAGGLVGLCTPVLIGGVIACHFNSTCSGLTSSANISENNDWFFGQVYTNSTVARPNHEVLTKN